MVKIPTYKKWLSHFMDVSLEQRSSEYNRVLSVVLSRGRIRLDAAVSTYSFEDLYESFSKILSQLDWDGSQPKKVLILGGGFLSIPQLLRPLLHDQSTYTVIEIDDQVIELSRKYLSPWHHQNVEIECADASQFVKINPTKFDLVCVDVFEDELVPESMRSLSFLQDLKAALAVDARLIFSTLQPNSLLEHKVQKTFEENFRTSFPLMRMSKTRGNRMYIYSHGT